MSGTVMHARFAWGICTGLLVLVLGALNLPHLVEPPPFNTRIVNNGVLPSAHRTRVLYQPFDAPRLDELARRERLQEVVGGEGTQFDQILRLKDWVAAQWPAGTPDPYPPWDAIVILDWIRSGKTGGFCGQYSQVFLQSLAALGFSARYVELGSRSNPYAHYVTEVWSNDFDKWVVIDVDYNLHFELDGVPQSAVEVRNAYLESDAGSLDVVLGDVREGHADPAFWQDRTAELYYYVRYHLTSNHLSNTDAIAFDRLGDMVDLLDRRVVPWEDSEVESEYPKERLTTLRPVDTEWAEAGLNQVHVRVGFAGADEITLQLQDNVLQGAGYEYRLLDADGRARMAWRAHREQTLMWPVDETGGVIEIRGVNIRGVTGPSVIVEARPREWPAHLPGTGR